MSRRALLAVLLVVTLGPVPVLYWLGAHAIARLEGLDDRLRGERAMSDLFEHVRRELPAQPATSVFPLDEPAVWPVRSPPDGSYLVHPTLLRSAAAAESGRLIDALEALEPLLAMPPAKARSEAESARTAATLRASELLEELGRTDDAGRLLARLEQRMAACTEHPAALARWVALRTSSGPGRAWREWLTEIGSRAVDLEELVLLRREAKRVGATESERRRLDHRVHWADWADELLAREALPEPPWIGLIRTRYGWFHVDPGDGIARSARRLSDSEALLRDWRGREGATVALKSPSATASPEDRSNPSVSGVVSSEGLTLDLGSSRLVWTLPEARLFGRWPPRALLASVLALYSLAAVVLVTMVGRKQRRAEELSRARGDLIAQVTHELRTPLTVLKMYGETLLQERVPAEARTEYLETISSEADRLSRLVDRVAEAARDEPAAPAVARIAVAPEVHTIVAKFRAVLPAGAAGIDLAADGLGSDVTVGIGRDDLALVLDVLLDNAVKYGDATRPIEMTMMRDEARVELAVRDHGPGIAPSEASHLFERWVRGDAGRRSGERGAGMGLYLARQRCRAVGGDVVIEAADPGTRVRVTLPCAMEETGS